MVLVHYSSSCINITLWLTAIGIKTVVPWSAPYLFVDTPLYWYLCSFYSVYITVACLQYLHQTHTQTIKYPHIFIFGMVCGHHRRKSFSAFLPKTTKSTIPPVSIIFTPSTWFPSIALWVISEYVSHLPSNTHVFQTCKCWLEAGA